MAITVYPVYLKGTPLLIFAHSEEDAKVPYQRVMGKEMYMAEFKKELEKAKEVHLKDGELMLSGPRISHKELLDHIDHMGIFSGHGKYKPSKSVQQKNPVPKLPKVEIQEPVHESIKVPEPALETTHKKIDLIDMFG